MIGAGLGGSVSYLTRITNRNASILAPRSIANRRLHLTDLTNKPNRTWVIQQARNLPMDLDERAERLRFLIRDRDAKFISGFDDVFATRGIKIIKTPPQAPRTNAIAERWVDTARREFTDRMLIFREHHLRVVLTEYTRHYNAHRPHPSLSSTHPEPLPCVANIQHTQVTRQKILGVLINEYSQVA